MARKKQSFPTTPKVALLVETSLTAGRDILQGITRYIRERGPWNVFYQPHDLAHSLPPWFASWEGDGIIARVQDQRILSAIETKRVPAVDVLGVLENAKPALPLVHVDNGKIACLAAEHLLSRGLRHFAFIGIADENWSSQRHAAFVEAVGEKNCQSLLLPRSTWKRTRWETLINRIATFLATLPLPCGVLLASDVEALAVYQAAQQAGLIVGGNLAILGVDDDHTLCTTATPQLTSIAANHTEVGYRAGELLDQLMAGGKAPAKPQLIAPSHIVARASTEVLGVNDNDLSHALHFIRLHAHETISAVDVAEHATCGRSILQRKFREHLGRTIQDELIRVRLEKAMELLRTTDLNTEIIAENSGFNYAQNMGKYFRRFLHASPRQYRIRSRR